jgi:tRNA A-37 threonylcarbamoyl transferase component Bud32
VRRLGRYTLIEPIASGGMAEVWRAEVAGPSGFVKQVAVKLVRADRGDDDEMVRMFVQEARLASALHHANVVHVFDLDLIEGRHVIAMELVHGRSLRAVLDRCREVNVRFGLPRAVHVAHQVARALAYAHRPVAEGGVAGLVHRDVSPQNVLVSFEGEVKLTDFGIARVEGAGGLTGPGTLKGKIGYMAPEQATGAATDARADLFALGVVLWELCTGQRLFARETEVATLRALTGSDRISPPSFWNENVPPALDALVMEMLERDPARRVASAGEVETRLAEVELALARTPDEKDLRPLMRRLWPGEVPSRPTPAPAPAERPDPPRREEVPAARPDATVTVTWPARPARRLAPLAAVAVVGAVAVAVGGFMAARQQPLPDVGRVLLDQVAAGPGAGIAADASPAASRPASERASVSAPAPASAPASSARDATVPPVAAPAAPGSSGSPLPPEGEGSAAAPSSTPPRPTPPRTRAARPGVLAAADSLEGLEVPPASTGEGLLFVNASPWAEIHLDGRAEGYTPREMRLAAGRHRLKLVHPSRGSVERDAVVRAGERLRVEVPLDGPGAR